jgi:hypothetical protein
VGQLAERSVVWLAAGFAPHPDLLAWCERYDFTIEHDPPAAV